MAERSFDVIIIGAGPAGENVADRAVRGGLSVAVVEGELAGGECSYWACMPSKALLRPLDIAAAATRVGGGVRVDGIDVPAVLKRRDSFVSRTDDGGHDDSGQVSWIESVDATFVRGHGRLDGERRVLVDGPDGSQALIANRAVVVATGSVATVPPIPGLREAQPWGSREVTNVEQVPDSVIILGGGVVGCESATALRGLGAEVTLVSAGPLLEKVEPFAGELVAQSLRDAGVTVQTGAKVSQVERGTDGRVTVGWDGGSASADQLVAALGRKPATEGLGVETVGLEPGKPIEVDDTLRSTEHDWLYAVGDVNGRVLLTHQGKYQARICADVLVARASGTAEGEIATDAKLTAYADHRMVPQVIFTDPQVGSVGLTADAARQQGFDVRVVEYDLGSVAGSALLADGYTGRASMVVDEARRVLLGVTFVGQDVAELLHSATVAVVGQVPLDVLWHAVPSYPTISEVWLRLMESYGL